MIEKFNEIIEKQLPTMVGQELKKVLEDYEHQKGQVEALRTQYNRQNEEMKTVKAHRDELQSIVNRIENKEEMLNEKLMKLDDELRTYQIKRLEHEVDCAKQVNDQLFRLTETVFKNPRMITTHETSKFVPAHYVGDGNYNHDSTHTETVTKTTEVD